MFKISYNLKPDDLSIEHVVSSRYSLYSCYYVLNLVKCYVAVYF